MRNVHNEWGTPRSGTRFAFEKNYKSLTHYSNKNYKRGSNGNVRAETRGHSKERDHQCSIVPITQTDLCAHTRNLPKWPSGNRNTFEKLRKLHFVDIKGGQSLLRVGTRKIYGWCGRCWLALARFDEEQKGRKREKEREREREQDNRMTQISRPVEQLLLLNMIWHNINSKALVSRQRAWAATWSEAATLKTHLIVGPWINGGRTWTLDRRLRWPAPKQVHWYDQPSTTSIIFKKVQTIAIAT